MARDNNHHDVISPAQIERWRTEDVRLEKEVKALEAQRAKLQTMIDAALSFLDEPIKAAPGNRRPKKYTTKKNAPRRAAKPKPSERAERGSWTTTIYEILSNKDRGVTYADLKEEIKKTHLAERLAKGEKGFYGGILKLSENKRIIKHNGHLFESEMYSKFQKAVDAGKVEDVEEPDKKRSPMGEAALAFLHTQPRGATSGEIIEELSKNKEFARAISSNKTFPYNVFARLIEKGDLQKDDGIYRLPPKKK